METMSSESSAVMRLSSQTARAGVRSSSPLFFPGSDTPAPTSRRSQRGDIHSSAPEPAPTPATMSVQAPVSEADSNAPVTVVWGTMVSLNASMDAFRSFLKDFKAKYRQQYDSEQPLDASHAHVYDDPETRVFESYMRKMRETSQTNLNLDMLDLASFPLTSKLFHQLQSYPQEIIPILDQVLKDEVLALADADLEDDGQFLEGQELRQRKDQISQISQSMFKVRPFGGDRTVNLRDLNPGDIDKLVSVKGLVIRATPVIPDMKLAFFRCLTCHHTVTVEIDRAKIAEPDRCPRDVCGTLGSMSLVHNRCDFADRQIIRLQETPDTVPDGQTPHTVSVCLYDELVDAVKPGDRVTLTGIFRSVSVRINPKQRVIKSLFKTYVDVVHIKRTDAKRLAVDHDTRDGDDRRGAIGVGGNDEEEAGDSALTQATRSDSQERLLELSKRTDIYDYLARSLAPSIYEMDDVKKGILLQLFGGTNKTIARGGGGGGPRYRGDINVLLVGDPGTSKSQMLQYVHKIAPRGVYTSGKGSSAVGLTAYVTRDPDTKQLVLESGALVLSDGGVCCIDEFDKMSDATRSVLHEVMEQQTVSVAKAGIITTLNARTSILASANPVGSRYNAALPITRNIDLPPTLISRFDLVYLVLDKVDEQNDRQLARHLVGLYLEDAPSSGTEDVLPVQLLSAYISFAKNSINPKLTEDASNALVKAYVEMRNLGTDLRTSDRRITATTRQLESMIRLSEAHARMRFSDNVELKDVEEAHRLIRAALKESATDPVTGLIDMDLINTGQGTAQRKLRSDLRRELLQLLDSKDPANRGVRWSELAKSMESQSSISVEASELAEVLKTLESEGIVKIYGDRDRRTVRRLGADSAADAF